MPLYSISRSWHIHLWLYGIQHVQYKMLHVNRCDGKWSCEINAKCFLFPDTTIQIQILQCTSRMFFKTLSFNIYQFPSIFNTRKSISCLVRDISWRHIDSDILDNRSNEKI